VLSYVDLDIDVLVEPDLTYRILDEDDFEQNAQRYGYPEEVQENARRALAEVIGLIESKSFPFDV
jgi:protein associated with RNAse G/E